MGNQIELRLLLQSSGADGAIVINSSGELIDALDIDHEGNIAAMTNVSLTMIDELTDDLGIGRIKQVTCKSESGLYVIQYFNDDCIVCIYSVDIAKAGFIMLALKAIKI